MKTSHHRSVCKTIAPSTDMDKNLNLLEWKWKRNPTWSSTPRKKFLQKNSHIKNSEKKFPEWKKKNIMLESLQNKHILDNKLLS